MRLFTCTWWMCVVNVNWSCQQRDLSTYYDVVTLVLSTMEISFQMRLPHVHLRRKFCISFIDNRDEYLLCFEAKFIIKQNKNIELISTLMESEQIKSAEAMRHHCFQWLSSCRLHRILQRASVYRWSMITPPKKQLHFNEYSFDWFFFVFVWLRISNWVTTGSRNLHSYTELTVQWGVTNSYVRTICGQHARYDTHATQPIEINNSIYLLNTYKWTAAVTAKK